MPSKIIPVKQWDDDSCGPASIEMTAQYLNMPLSRTKIIAASRYKERDGMTNVQLVEALRELGFQVEDRSLVSWEKLQTLNTADSVLIVSWMLRGYIGHFSVVDRITDSHIYLAEPEAGTLLEFDKIMFLRLWMDYDEKWYPELNTDIQLRWVCVVKKNL